MPKLVVMLRVKDGMRFLPEWLEATERFADEIVVVDNGSTDGSLIILENHPKVVEIRQTAGFDEGRDKIMLYEMARSRNPDWLLWLDVDEVFEERANREVMEQFMRSRLFTKIFFRRFHFIDPIFFNMSPYWFTYMSWPDRLMWKEAPGGYFENLQLNNGLVRGIRGLARPSHIRIKHLGYSSKDLVAQKQRVYRSIDPTLEQTYVRMEHRVPSKWRWRERESSPAMVTAIDLSLDIAFLFRYIVAASSKAFDIFRRTRKIAKSASNRVNSY